MEWEKSWYMLFHPPKCVSLPITRSRSPLDYSYEFHGHTLDSVSSAQYLGITIQQDMDWDNHINNVVNKANTSNRTLGFLQRNLKIILSAIKDREYKAFVRSILEYASSVWDPYSDTPRRALTSWRPSRDKLLDLCWTNTTLLVACWTCLDGHLWNSAGRPHS